MGIFKLLDSQCKTPKATDLKFCAQVYQEHGKHPCLLVPKRRPREDVEFTVKHFAGDVRYACANFMEKNNDSLDQTFKSMLAASKSSVVREIVAQAEAREAAQADAKKPGPAKSAAFISVSRRFCADINALIDALNSTTAHFVRCMKPNPRFAKGDFDNEMIMAQLRCNGTLEAVQLMRNGFPNRVPYDLMYDRYKKHLMQIPEVAKLTPAQFCEILVAIADLDAADYALGVSKIFLRAGKGKFLEDLKEKPVDEVLPILKRKMKAVSYTHLTLPTTPYV